MAAFVKYDQFVEDMGAELHNLASDTLRIALTNTAPTVATDAVLADITEIADGNGYTSGTSGEVTTTTWSETAGTATLAGDDTVFTAAGGAIAQFQYAVLYNDTSASNSLIGYWDYGSAIDLANGETFTVDFGASILTWA
jgi:hypothetical protein